MSCVMSIVVNHIYNDNTYDIVTTQKNIDNDARAQHWYCLR